ncbi:MAG: ferredoxin reductase family protein [bacterium]|nr:ferredoxin reductase family protein [bacterium]
MTALGRLFGLFAVYFVLLQFVLIGRSVWVEGTFGLDRLTRIHHWNGFLAITFILLHPTLIITSYALGNGVGFFSQFVDLILNYDDVLKAFLAVIVFITIIFFSISIGRKKLKYESWYYIHLGTYLAVLLAWGHQLELGNDFAHTPAFVYFWYGLYAVVLGNFVLWRFLKPLLLFYRHQFFVSRVERETPSSVSVYISGVRMEDFKISAGQFMIFRFLEKGFWLQAHPFSLSAVPQSNEIRITVKNVGDFTARVPVLEPGTKVLIDGPYGTFTEARAKQNKILFLAGGIGITPIRAMLESLHGAKDAALIYGSRTERDVVFASELDRLVAQYHFPVHHVMSEEAAYAGEKGRIHVERIARLVPDFKERDIYICGPKPMLDMLRKELHAAGVPRANIHFERFALQ